MTFSSDDKGNISGDMAEVWRMSLPQSWSPEIGRMHSFPHVPEHMAKAAKELYLGASVGNTMSAILMARTVFEASAKDKGITAGSLKTKITMLKEQPLSVKPRW